MEETEQILLENHEEYSTTAREALAKRRFNTATTLYFKAIVALCDLHILRTSGRVPSSHSARFRILKEKYPAIYRIVDRDFPFYQDSYTAKMDEETALLLKEDAETLKKTVGA
jgi:hypothetical protein